MTEAANIVACVLHRDGLICVLQRSEHVSWDAGKWHCVTGYLPQGADPLAHAYEELNEETGLGERDVDLTSRPRPLTLDGGGRRWVVYVFHFTVHTAHLLLNRENSAYQWVARDDLTSLECVDWLQDVVDSSQPVRRDTPRATGTGRVDARDDRPITPPSQAFSGVIPLEMSRR